MDKQKRGGRGHWHRERAVSLVVATLLMVAIAVVLSAVVFIGVQQISPEKGYTAQPQAAFTYEYDNGTVKVYPEQMTNSAKFHLVVKGAEVYTWEGQGATDVRTLRCLYPGDTVRIVADTGEKTYVNSAWDVQSPTKCPIDGTSKRFTTVMVNDKKEPVFRSKYEFTLKVDPDGPTSVLGDQDIPVSNQWHWVQRYNRTVEGYNPPVYVIVLADNANYGSSPSGGIDKAYSIDSGGNIVIEASSSNEPTNDVYMVFRPGCDESKLKFIGESAAYNNQILLGDTVVIPNTNNANDGDEYTAPGVDCIPN